MCEDTCPHCNNPIEYCRCQDPLMDYDPELEDDYDEEREAAEEDRMEEIFNSPCHVCGAGPEADFDYWDDKLLCNVEPDERDAIERIAMRRVSEYEYRNVDGDGTPIPLTELFEFDFPPRCIHGEPIKGTKLAGFRWLGDNIQEGHKLNNDAHQLARYERAIKDPDLDHEYLTKPEFDYATIEELAASKEAKKTGEDSGESVEGGQPSSP